MAQAATAAVDWLGPLLVTGDKYWYQWEVGVGDPGGGWYIYRTAVAGVDGSASQISLPHSGPFRIALHLAYLARIPGRAFMCILFTNRGMFPARRNMKATRSPFRPKGKPQVPTAPPRRWNCLCRHAGAPSYSRNRLQRRHQHFARSTLWRPHVIRTAHRCRNCPPMSQLATATKAVG